MPFVTVNVSAPSSADSFRWYAVSAKAATLITSNHTNRLNKSWVNANPVIAPRNTSIMEWNRAPTSLKNPQAKTKSAVTRSAANTPTSALP